MPLIDTSLLQPNGTLWGRNTLLTPSDNHQLYNGLDCCLTSEVHNALQPLLSGRPNAQRIYSFERALCAPYLEIMCRGFLVDDVARQEACQVLRARISNLQGLLNELGYVLTGHGLNPRSHVQLKDLFYQSLNLPGIWSSKKGERKLSMDRETLEKLYDHYLFARPFVSCILSIRDLGKQLERFEDEIDSDGRYRASYNIAGTETGRPSSSSNAFGTGGNAQNIAPNLRYVFIADFEWKLCVIDLEQVEARDVGYFCGCLFSDWTFLEACEGGDLHTTNARRIWPDLPWGDDPSAWRGIADRIFYRDFSYRYMAKRGSHLSNYMGTAFTAARALKVPKEMMEDFQDRYCRGNSCAYPAIQRWWEWTARQIQTTRLLTTPFGRERHFFGRPTDDTTLREAIAFLPQSTTADRMNLGLWRVWQKMPQVQLLAQTHDSITFQYREEDDEDVIISNALQLIRVALLRPDGSPYIVPGEAKIGWNWGNYNIDPTKGRLNPEGLLKWNSSKPDQRRRSRGGPRERIALPS